MFRKETKIKKTGTIEVISVNKDVEVPYELVKIYDGNGNGRLHTRNIRNVKEDLRKKENIAKQKELELEKAKKEAKLAEEKAKKESKD